MKTSLSHFWWLCRATFTNGVDIGSLETTARENGAEYEQLLNRFKKAYKFENIPIPLAPQSCVWTQEDDAWITGCGNMFTFIDGGPQENCFLFCCYCGKSLHEAE